jgi:heme exporter protein C
MNYREVGMKIWYLYFASILSLLASLTFVLLYIPAEASQGFVQKIFFFHVPAAFTMYLSLILGALYSAVFLYTRKEHFDLLAKTFITTALCFASIVIISGPIWAKPIWGVYWTWDPRLTTTFLIFVLLVGYMLVRRLIADKTKAALISSLIALIAVADVPIIHWSVKLWRGVHPSVLSNKEGLPSSYIQGLEYMSMSFFLLGGLLSWIFYRIFLIQQRLALLERRNIEERD